MPRRKSDWHDERWKPIIDFAYENYRATFGITLLLDATDTKALKGMLIKTANLPEFSLENLKTAWVCFTASPNSFDREQPHPMRFWANGINRFMLKSAKNGNGNLDAAKEFVRKNLK